MLYDLSIMSERKVYVIQEIPGSQAGTPKINIMGAASYATSNKFNFSCCVFVILDCHNTVVLSM